ncbi:hypothetical protein EBAPG3_007480 [Nitrosospira lacus]|uniref:Uncharacterized protein n=1 Tax=Nitrosospira lacus TaxID=1288494 RepID=A0A1W6SP95_9PROT|nr:hypothetical protein EBAPG3_007480 [Nitrosospira lacus]
MAFRRISHVHKRERTALTAQPEDAPISLNPAIDLIFQFGVMINKVLCATLFFTFRMSLLRGGFQGFHVK